MEILKKLYILYTLLSRPVLQVTSNQPVTGQKVNAFTHVDG